MNCPYCGEPMEKGFMVTHVMRDILWIPQTAEWAPFAFYTREEIEERYNGLVLTQGGRVFKKQHPWKSVVSVAPMDICRDCKKGIYSFDDAEEKET